MEEAYGEYYDKMKKARGCQKREMEIKTGEIAAKIEELRVVDGKFAALCAHVRGGP